MKLMCIIKEGKQDVDELQKMTNGLTGIESRFFKVVLLLQIELIAAPSEENTWHCKTNSAIKEDSGCGNLRYTNR